MNSEQRQLRQTIVFLRTSFEAIQHSIAGRLDDPLPCWLDTGMLTMLSRELNRCCQQAKAVFPPSRYRTAIRRFTALRTAAQAMPRRAQQRHLPPPARRDHAAADRRAPACRHSG